MVNWFGTGNWSILYPQNVEFWRIKWHSHFCVNTGDFFSVSLNNYLCHFIFCASHTSTCTCSACIPLAGARHRSSSHCRSTPSKQLAPRPTFSPRCLSSSVSVPVMQCSLLFHFLTVFLSNSAIAEEWVAIVYSFFSSLITCFMIC